MWQRPSPPSDKQWRPKSQTSLYFCPAQTQELKKHLHTQPHGPSLPSLIEKYSAEHSSTCVGLRPGPHSSGEGRSTLDTEVLPTQPEPR